MQKLLRLLMDKGAEGATTIEICDACNTTRASSDVSELRACLAEQSIQVASKYVGKTESGRKVYRYFLN